MTHHGRSYVNWFVSTLPASVVLALPPTSCGRGVGRAPGTGQSGVAELE